MEKYLVSKFRPHTSEVETNVSIWDELEKIKNGYYSELVLKARKQYFVDKTQYSRLKKNLPSVTFSGTFDVKRLVSNLKSYSGCIILDLDSINNIELLNKKKKEIFTELFVIAVWLSPSGAGLKILIKLSTPFEYHKIAFIALENYFSLKHQISIDISGSDVSRLCFTSFDEELLMKTNFSEFSIEDVRMYIKEKEQSNRTITKSQSINLKEISKNESFLLNSPTGRNKRKDRETIMKIIRFLTFNKKSITNTYEDWYRVAMAIANTFTYDLGHSYFLKLCRLDNELHDEEKCDSLLRYCYIHRRLNIINFGTIIYLAQNKGFNTDYLPKKLNIE